MDNSILLALCHYIFDDIPTFFSLNMAPDIVTSAILLAVNIGFLCFGGIVFSVIESKALEKQVNSSNIFRILIL